MKMYIWIVAAAGLVMSLSSAADCAEKADSAAVPGVKEKKTVKFKTSGKHKIFEQCTKCNYGKKGDTAAVKTDNSGKTAESVEK
jgi:hypothetical protein